MINSIGALGLIVQVLLYLEVTRRYTEVLATQHVALLTRHYQ